MSSIICNYNVIIICDLLALEIKKVFDKITEQETVHVEDDVGDGSFVGGIGHCEMGSSFYRGFCGEVLMNPSFQALLKTWRGLSFLFLFFALIFLLFLPIYFTVQLIFTIIYVLLFLLYFLILFIDLTTIYVS